MTCSSASNERPSWMTSARSSSERTRRPRTRAPPSRRATLSAVMRPPAWVPDGTDNLCQLTQTVKVAARWTPTLHRPSRLQQRLHRHGALALLGVQTEPARDEQDLGHLVRGDAEAARLGRGVDLRCAGGEHL